MDIPTGSNVYIGDISMNIFIDNKYTNWYYNLVLKRKQNIPEGYFERHHIIPKSIGGNNNSDNIVCLTAREHFIAHWLLTKMVSGQNRYKMEFALNAMSRVSSNQERKLTSYQFARCKIAHSIAMKNTIPRMVTDPITREKWYKAMEEVNSRPEVKKKRSNSQKISQNSEKTILKRKLTHNTKEYKEKQSLASKESQNRPEVKLKKSIAAKNNHQKPNAKEKYTLAAIECQNRPEVKLKKSEKLKSQNYVCPHCNKIGVGPAMFRHHFARCKSK
jgi:hypothetical protein